MPGKSLCRFGDGVEIKAWIFSIPVIIGNTKRKIVVDVVDSNIPILISKPTMSRMGINTKFSKHNFVLLILECNFAEHYCLSVASWA